MIRLDHHLPSVRFLEGLLVTIIAHFYNAIVRKHILSLSIHHLVGAEPVTHLIQVVVEVLEEIAVVSLSHSLSIITAQLGSNGVVQVDSQQLPVHLPLIDEGDGSIHLHRIHLADLVGNVAEVHDIQRVVVSLELANIGHLPFVGILPRLGNGSVVDHRRGAVETESSLLHILLDRVEWDLRCNFRFRALSTASSAQMNRTRAESP